MSGKEEEYRDKSEFLRESEKSGGDTSSSERIKPPKRRRNEKRIKSKNPKNRPRDMENRERST